MSPFYLWTVTLLIVGLVGICPNACAEIIGPYTSDVHTIHLYQFDENMAVGTTTADVGSATTLYELTTTGGTGGGTTQGISFSGFGTALDTSGTSNSAGAEFAIDNLVDSTLFWNSDSMDAIPDGAFTWEAIVRFNNLSATTQSIIALENEGATGRYARLNYLGNATESSRVLSFRYFVSSGPGADTEVTDFNSVSLPSTGSDALNTTDWFHIAVAYDGNENTDNNFKFYFTKLSSDVTSAHLLSSNKLLNDLAGSGGTHTTNTGDFAVGNNARSLGSKFVGLIDEVRISDIARSANQMTFAGHPGDFDNDGDVDGADFVAWQTNFPTAEGATLAQGDADGDGDVDGADFVVWQTNFPFTPGPGVASVPEPSGIALISAALIAGMSSLRWRSR